MVDQTLFPAIRETIKQNEIGDQTPYVLSYARKGKSGASFGSFQGDTNASPVAQATLRQVLTAATDASTVTRVMNAVCKALPDGNPLSIADTKTANKALASTAGQKLVDAMDLKLMQTVLDGVDTCYAAAKVRKLFIEPIAVLYIAPWVNMSGPPTLLSTWIKGSPVYGLPVPTAPDVTRHNMQAYLQATAYFQANPKNFIHYEACIAKGAVLLPGAQNVA